MCERAVHCAPVCRPAATSAARGAARRLYARGGAAGCVHVWCLPRPREGMLE